MLTKINSKYILNIVFDNLKKKMKLKILKYNKNMLKINELRQKGFQWFFNIKRINEELNTKIEDIEIKSLILRNKNLGNLKLICLNKLESKDLKEIQLTSNKISDITMLENYRFENLEILGLRRNNLSNIKPLEKVNFRELKKLDLSWNQILHIDFLKNVKFEKLEELNINHNKISDINILENVNFRELIGLYLNYNRISDISVLEEVKFEKLNSLVLSDSQISDIDELEKVNFPKLLELSLSDNKISNIEVLEKVKFNLFSLNLSGNKVNKKLNSSLIEKLKSQINYLLI